MASNITVDTLTKGAVTLNTDELVDVNNTRVCKAWVNFNGTGTVAIRASYNVSSITDNSVGQFTINFTTVMSDVNYGFAGNTHEQNVRIVGSNAASQTTSALRIACEVVTTAAARDTTYIYVTFFGN